MSDGIEQLRSRLSAAHAEALRVHDSPLRADRLGEQLRGIADRLADAGLAEDPQVRVAAALDDALRVLRRDDDGREAARHLQAALSQIETRTRKPSPFLDD